MRKNKTFTWFRKKHKLNIKQTKKAIFFFEKILLIKNKATNKKKYIFLLTVKTLICQNYLSEALLKYLL